MGNTGNKVDKQLNNTLSFSIVGYQLPKIETNNPVNKHQELARLYEKAKRSFEKGKYEKSLHLFKMLMCVHEVNNPNLISINDLQYEIGLVNMKLEKYEDALISLNKSYKVYRKILPQKHIFMVNLLCNFGNCLFNLIEYDKALDCYSKAFDNLSDFPPSNQNKLLMGQLLNSIASVFYKMGEYDNALKCLNEAKKKFDHPTSYNDLSHLLNNIGLVLFKLKRYDEALKYLSDSIETQK